MRNPEWMEEDARYEAAQELAHERRKTYRCPDRMCGADDCENCRPGCTAILAAEEAAEREECKGCKNPISECECETEKESQ